MSVIFIDVLLQPLTSKPTRDADESRHCCLNQNSLTVASPLRHIYETPALRPDWLVHKIWCRNHSKWKRSQMDVSGGRRSQAERNSSGESQVNVYLQRSKTVSFRLIANLWSELGLKYQSHTKTQTN